MKIIIGGCNMENKEGKVRIYTKNEEVKRIILNIIKEKTGLELIIQNRYFEFKQSVYDEIGIMIMQKLALENHMSSVVIEPVECCEKKKEPIIEKDSSKEDLITPLSILYYIDEEWECTEWTTKEVAKTLTISEDVIGLKLKELEKQGKVKYLGKEKWKRTFQWNEILYTQELEDLMVHIMNHGRISLKKISIMYNRSESDIECVLAGLENQGYLRKFEKGQYEVLLESRILTIIKENPHIQFETLNQRIKLVKREQISVTLNRLVIDRRVMKDGRKGYIVA